MHTHFRDHEFTPIPPIVIILTEFFFAFLYPIYACAFFHSENPGSQRHHLIH